MPNAPTKLIIRGGLPISGEVTVSGAKNAVTKLMVASLLTSDPVVLYNAPHIDEVAITSEILQQLGTQVTFGQHELTLATPEILNSRVEQQTRKNRISVLALGPLLQRVGEAKLPVVGGDKIGARPVNYHIEALREMGAEITETEEGYEARAKRLQGAEITLPYPSVGATENIILAAVTAKDRTIIRNAATEPEINSLIMMLQRMGAIIEYRANRVVIIDGVEKLHGTSFEIMGDRLEAASYACLGLATNGKIMVRGSRQSDLATFLSTVRRMGADYHISNEGITFMRKSDLKSIAVKTDVWPGFSSDWQQPLCVLLTQANGKSVIHETVYEDRFEYTKTLNRMGADISLFDARKKGMAEKLAGTHYNRSAAIIGPTPLHGESLEVPDIRAGMAYVIAALVAEGTSEITGIEHLLRGYDDFLSKLESVGADFTAE